MSNRSMEHPNLNSTASDHTDQRLINLEIKASYTEDLLDQLDAVIVRQQQQIDLLISEITRLRQPVSETGVSATRNPRDELPPHY